jgi:hypothetical protein
MVRGTVPDASTLQQSVTIDKVAVTVSRDTSPQTATISNQLPGPVDLELRSDPIPGVTAELDKKRLLPGEKALIRFRTTGGSKGSGTVRIVVSPIAFVSRKISWQTEVRQLTESLVY